MGDDNMGGTPDGGDKAEENKEETSTDGATEGGDTAGDDDNKKVDPPTGDGDTEENKGSAAE